MCTIDYVLNLCVGNIILFLIFLLITLKYFLCQSVKVVFVSMTNILIYSMITKKTHPIYDFFAEILCNQFDLSLYEYLCFDI
jgi:hypothetical protein